MSGCSLTTLTDTKKAQLLNLSTTTRHEFEQRLNIITVHDDFKAKLEGDIICILILTLEALEELYKKEENGHLEHEEGSDDYTSKLIPKEEEKRKSGSSGAGYRERKKATSSIA